MLLWKQDITYQFLEPCKNLEKEYREKLRTLTHDLVTGEIKPHEVLRVYPHIKRLYRCHSHKGEHEIYAEARYAAVNGAIMN